MFSRLYNMMKPQICSGFLVQVLLLGWLVASNAAGVASNDGPALGLCEAGMKPGLSKWPQEISPPCAEASESTASKQTS